MKIPSNITADINMTTRSESHNHQVEYIYLLPFSAETIFESMKMNGNKNLVNNVTTDLNITGIFFLVGIKKQLLYRVKKLFVLHPPDGLDQGQCHLLAEFM